MRHGIGLVRRLLAVPMQERGGTVFEDLRGTYLFTSVFDTHFLLIWLLAAATILSIYLAITHHSPWRVLLSAGLCGAITLAHVYEGILLLAILGGVVLLLWRRGFEVRSAVITGSACAFVIMGTLMLLALLQRHSGLPMPGWREYPIFLTMFVAGFPVQVMVIVPQLRRYWRESTPADVFLLGWIAGCLAVSFSSPFYPYPGRGLMTLQIPLAIVAASIYFRDRLSMPTSHLIMALLLLGFTPVQVVRNLNRRLQFREDVPRVWLSPEHREILAVLHKTSHPNDILAARPDDVGWLAPEFPGRHYAGHFFLTVDFARKRDEIERLSQLSVEDRERFLLDNGVTLLYMDSAASPASFRGMRGLTPLVENGAGSLFRFSPGPPDGG